MQGMPCPVSRFSLLAPERGKSRHDQIAAILGIELLQGLYQSGGVMPVEAALMERFHVSRTVVREVMKTLAAKGFVAPSTRAGTRVRDTVYWNYFDSDVLAWRLRLGLDAEFMQTLTQVRRALEPVAAALAAQRRRPEDIALLRECLRQIGRRNHTRQSFSAADRDFHVAICSASGNPIIRSIASVIETALTPSSAGTTPADDPAHREVGIDGYAAIVDAIETGDAQRASQGIRDVIDTPI